MRRLQPQSQSQGAHPNPVRPWPIIALSVLFMAGFIGLMQMDTPSNFWGLLAIAGGMGIVIGAMISMPRSRPSTGITHDNEYERLLEVYNHATNQASIVLVTDLVGNITHVNDAFCEISGYASNELIGNNCSMVNSGYHPREFFKDMFRTIGRGDLWHGEVCNRRKDGSLYWIDTTIVPLKDAGGKIYEYYSLRIDITQKKETENELRTILDALPSMVLYKDEQNTVLRVNQATAQTVGISTDQIVGRSATEFFSRDDSWSSFDDDIEVLASGQAKMGIIEPIQIPSGELRTMRIDKIPLLDSTGFYSRIVTIATDITELAELEQRLSLSIESSKAGVWDWDIGRGTLHTNDLYFTMLGDDPLPSPIQSGHYFDRVHPDDIDMIRAQIDHTVQSGIQDYYAEFRLMHADGAYRWISSTGKVIEHNSDGSARRIIGQHLDIDSTKRLNNAIRSALELGAGEDQTQTLTHLCRSLAETTQSSCAAVAQIYDDHGVQKARIIAGSNQDRMIVPFDYALSGTPCHEAALEDFCLYEDDVASKFPDDVTLAEMDARGYAGLRLSNSAGKIIGILMILDTKPLNSPIDPKTALKLYGARVSVELEYSENASRLREAAELAESLSRSKSEFLANMSHEIRTPMTAILGYTELLEEGDDSIDAADDRLETIQTIRTNGQHLLTIINDILDISKIEARKLNIERICVRPLNLLHNLELLLADRALGKGLDLKIDFDTPIPETIRTDPTRLRQILLNLVGNAIKFTEVGSVNVRCSLTDSDPQMLKFEVHDTGIGLSGPQADHIFDAFTQADTSTTRRFGGSGLGLNISTSLAEMLGGGISVQSTPGEGSVFTLTINPGPVAGIPLVGADQYTGLTAPHQSQQARPTNGLDGFRVLLVEDGPDNQRLLSHHLRKAGATVDSAENGRVGVDMVFAHDAPHYDLIIMDMQMPVLDGYGAATELRERGSTRPILALTAHAMSGDQKKCLDAGCSAYHTKPIIKAEFLTLCAQLIESHQANRPDQQAA